LGSVKDCALQNAVRIGVPPCREGNCIARYTNERPTRHALRPQRKTTGNLKEGLRAGERAGRRVNADGTKMVRTYLCLEHQGEAAGFINKALRGPEKKKLTKHNPKLKGYWRSTRWERGAGKGEQTRGRQKSRLEMQKIAN